MRQGRVLPIPLLLFILVSLVGLVLSPSIGAAWDEPDNMFAGGVYVNFIKNGFNKQVFDTYAPESSYFENRIFPLDRYLSHLPPVYNYVGTVFALIGERFGAPLHGRSVIVAYHLATVLFFALLVVMTYHMARLLGLSLWASALAALFTFLYPTLFGHGLSNSKDTAQAALFITSLYFLIRSTTFDSGNRGDSRNLILGAIVWGLGLATKFNAIYVPVIWFIWSATRIKNYELRMKNNANIFFILYSLFLLLVVGFATTVAVWPYLWFDPLNHAKEVIDYFMTVGRGYKFFWEGAIYSSGLGVSYFWYPIGSFLLGTPLGLLFFITIGVIRGIREIRRKKLLLFIWIAVPTLRAFLPTASLYDQLRHFVEILPAFMILAAMGVEELGPPARRRYGPLRPASTRGELSEASEAKGLASMVAIVAGVGVLGHLVFINLTYFPYSTGYYNIFAQNTNRNFDRDIESLSIKEGIEYLHKKYGPIVLWCPIGGHQAWYYMTAGDQYVYSSSVADSIVLINKSVHVRQWEFDEAIRDTFTLDHVIARGDAIFGWVYRRK